MNRAELRALRLAIIDGKMPTSEQALAVVSALEELAAASEREFGTYDEIPRHRDPCVMEPTRTGCPNEASATSLRVVLRRAGPLPGSV